MGKGKIIWLVLVTGIMIFYIINVYLPQKAICSNMFEVYKVDSVNNLSGYEGKWVDVEYEFGFMAMYSRGNYFIHDYNYGYFKMKDKEEYICLATPGLIEIDMRGKNFFFYNSKAEKNPDVPTMTVRGVVIKTSPEDKAVLVNKIKTSSGEYKMMNTPENTELEYFVELMDMDVERDRMQTRSLILYAIIAVWLASLVILIRAIILYVREQRENAEMG